MDQNQNPINKFTNLIKQQNKEFVSDEVLQLCEPLGKSLSRGGNQNSKTQIRKFYGLIRATNNKGSAEKIKIELRILQAQVAYAVARKTINREFKDLFDVSLHRVISSKDLKRSLSDFATFFEALYAYFYYHSEVRR